MSKLLFISIGVLFLSACTVAETATSDIREAVDGGKAQVAEILAEKKQEVKDVIDAKLEDMKQNALRTVGDFAHSQIDEWLRSQGLNEYGDDEGTMYTGGTPLFDESTGESRDKYDYILSKHPELLDILATSSTGDTLAK